MRPVDSQVPEGAFQTLALKAEARLIISSWSGSSLLLDGELDHGIVGTSHHAFTDTMSSTQATVSFGFLLNLGFVDCRVAECVIQNSGHKIRNQLLQFILREGAGPKLPCAL